MHAARIGSPAFAASSGQHRITPRKLLIPGQVSFFQQRRWGSKAGKEKSGGRDKATNMENVKNVFIVVAQLLLGGRRSRFED
jgi:hypothetical protein